MTFGVPPSVSGALSASPVSSNSGHRVRSIRKCEIDLG
jgi:hypothetical protein